MPADDARHVEDVLDDPRLRARVALDDVERPVRVAGRAASLPQHRRPAEDRVERRAQLVRHRREELVLRAIGALGLLARLPFALEQRRELLERVVALARALTHLLHAQPLALVEEIDERLHARPQHVRVEGLRDVVGGAGRVALAGVQLVAMDGESGR